MSISPPDPTAHTHPALNRPSRVVPVSRSPTGAVDVGRWLAEAGIEPIRDIAELVVEGWVDADGESTFEGERRRWTKEGGQGR